MTNNVNVQDIARQAKIQAFSSLGITDPKMLAALLGDEIKVTVPTPPVAPKGKGKKTLSASPVAPSPVAPLMRATLQTAPVQPVKRVKVAICGVKTDGSGAPCPRCNGPYNPFAHMVLSDVVTLDCGPQVTAHNWAQDYNGNKRVFAGYSGDPAYADRVVILGLNRWVVSLPDAVLRQILVNLSTALGI